MLARFDDLTTIKLEDLRTDLYKAGYLEKVSEWKPHITFGAYEDIDIKSLLEWVKEFSKNCYTFDMSLSSFGILPPSKNYPDTAVIFIAPSPSKKLFSSYYGFHKKLDEFCGKIGYPYSAACTHAYPFHSTIGVFNTSKLQTSLEYLFRHFTPITAKIIALEVYTYPMKLIKRFDFLAK